MVSTFKGTAADLHVLRLPGEGESSLIARTASEAALLVSGTIEGELIGRETAATDRAMTGKRCVEIVTAVIEHDPGLLAERQTHALIVRAADHVLRVARDGSVDQRRQSRAALRSVLDETLPLPSDVMTGLRRLAAWTMRDAEGATVTAIDRAALIRAVEDASVTTAASEMIGPLRHRVQLGVRRLIHDRNAFMAVGRVDRVRGIDQALGDWSAALAAHLAEYAERQDVQANEGLADANLQLSATMIEPDTRPRAGWFAGMKAWMKNFLFMSEAEPIEDDLRRSLEGHLEARLAASAARDLSAVVSAAIDDRANDAAIDRVVVAVTAIRDGALAAVSVLDEQAAERQRRVNGVLLPAHPEIRDELLQQANQLTEASLADVLIATQVEKALEDGAIDHDRLEDAVLDAGRRLTQPLRDASLTQAMEQISPARLNGLVKLLVSPTAGLEFRPGFPTPAIFRRVAVPGGPAGTLGAAVRLRAPQIEITPLDVASEPLSAFGIAITEVFAPTALAGFHGSWRQAHEATRAGGSAFRLVSDRRLLEMGDGILSDQDIDDLIGKAVGCDAMASSKESAEHAGTGGTWYLLPEGQTERPANVDPTRLDSVFRGQRLGKSLPEIRRTLRHSPQHRAWIAKRWEDWRTATSPAERIARLSHLTAAVRLPNDELVPTMRALKNREGRQRPSLVA